MGIRMERKKALYPLKLSKVQNGRHMDLLLIANGDDNHYCYIKNLENLLDHSILMVRIKYISADSAYMDFRGTKLKTYHNTEELMKK